MAEEGLVLPVTPEMSKVSGVSLRRNSTGKASSSNNGETILPHYLRASTGSCHDFCKFGRKHVIEAKARHPMTKRTAKQPFDVQSPIEIIILPEKKKTTMIVPKSSPTSKSLDADATTFIKHRIRSSQSPTKSPPSQSPVQRDILKERKTGMVKPRTLHSTTLKSYTPRTKKQEVSSSSEKVDISLKPYLRKARESKLPENRDTFLKPKPMKVKPLTSASSSGDTNPRRNNDVRIRKSTETSSVAPRKISASSAASSSTKSVGKVANTSSRKQKSLKVVPPLKNQNKIRKAEPEQVHTDEVEEKTLYVIKMETENKPWGSHSHQNEISDFESSPHPPSSSPESLCLPNSTSLSPQKGEDQDGSDIEVDETESESFLEDDDIDTDTEDTSNCSEKGKSDRRGTFRTEGMDSNSSRLKFSRGKVINIHSENDSPRRLKFRRGRLLGENQKMTEVQRINLKKGEVEIDAKHPETATEQVVLRHQDVQGKKDAQGLLNNVIEETASKLVETRKSKVKALVGAFETVISLQETKPSANAAG